MSSSSSRQRHALVTGASGDLGSAIAHRLAQAGCHVWVHASSQLARAEAVVQAIRAAGGSADPLVFDVTDAAAVQQALATLLERQPIDEDNARALLLQLAAEQYDAIGNSEYETVRLRRLLTGRKPMPELDAELLQSAVSKVRVTNKCVTVTLKNGQTIERRDQL